MRWAGHVESMGKRKCSYRVLVGNLRTTWKPPVIDGRIISRWIFRKRGGGVDRIKLAQNGDRWWVIVKDLMNLRIP